MQHLDIRFGARRFLWCDVESTADGRRVGYGNLLRHVDQAIRTAAALRATLVLIPPRRAMNPAVYQLDSPDMRIAAAAGWRTPLIRGIWRGLAPIRHGGLWKWVTGSVASAVRPALETAKHAARRRQWRTLDRRLDGLGHRARVLSHRYELRVAARWHRLFSEARERARSTDSKRHPLRIQLRLDAERDAERRARDAGLDPARPLVALHVREAGFRQRAAARQQDLDRIREARIDTYAEAVSWLVAQGYQVVRIGDPSMTPWSPPGVVDAATATWRTGGFELWAMRRSRFFIASDSGPYFLAQLFGVPVLAVNVIQVGYYTRRPHDRYICKLVYDRVLARPLGVAEMLTEAFVRDPLDLERYEWLDNSAEDIREAVEDFTAGLEGAAGARTPAQERHDRLLARLAAEWRPAWRSRRSLVVRRGGPGTISVRFAARYLDSLGSPRLEPTSRMR